MAELDEKDAVVEDGSTVMEATDATADDQILDVPGKRRAHFSGDKDRRKKLKTTTAADVDKNACMLLNEKCLGVVYNILSQVGPVHMPVFTIQVVANGQSFVGSGPSKKRAKMIAAEMAVQGLGLLTQPSSNESTELKSETDFTDNAVATSHVTSTAGTPDTGATSKPSLALESTHRKADSAPTLSGKHPVLMLNELRPRAEYTLIDEDGKDRKFQVTVDGQTFEGIGQSKKLAKAKTAENALNKLFGITFSYQEDGQPVFQGDDKTWTKYKIKENTQSCDTINGKNPIQMVNELFPQLNYEDVDVSNEVTVGTKFCIIVEIDKIVYRGEGSTKKMAKTNCAVAVVRALTDSGVLASKMAEKEAKKRKAMRYFPGVGSSTVLNSSVIKLAVHFPDLQYRLVSQNDMWNNGQVSYTVAVTARGENFMASGPTEQAAKNAAADKVLSRFGLWSESDKQRKEKASRMEADSTNSSTRGRGFRGRGFRNRGVNRGGRISNAATTVALSAIRPSFAAVPPKLGESLLGSSSEWHGASSRGLQRGGRGVGRGRDPVQASGASFGNSANSSGGNGWGRGSKYAGSSFRGGRGGIASRGNLGHGASGRPVGRGGVGRGANSYGHDKIQDTGALFQGQNSERFGRGSSHAGAKFNERPAAGGYQTNTADASRLQSSYPAQTESQDFNYAGNLGNKLASWSIQEKSGDLKSEPHDKTGNYYGATGSWNAATSVTGATNVTWNTPAYDASNTFAEGYTAGGDDYGYNSAFPSSLGSYETNAPDASQTNRFGYLADDQSTAQANQYGYPADDQSSAQANQYGYVADDRSTAQTNPFGYLVDDRNAAQANQFGYQSDNQSGGYFESGAYNTQNYDNSYEYESTRGYGTFYASDTGNDYRNM